MLIVRKIGAGSGSEITGPFINNLIKSAPGKLSKTHPEEY